MSYEQDFTIGIEQEMQGGSLRDLELLLWWRFFTRRAENAEERHSPYTCHLGQFLRNAIPMIKYRAMNAIRVATHP
jgi:hypothetical protein